MYDGHARVRGGGRGWINAASASAWRGAASVPLVVNLTLTHTSVNHPKHTQQKNLSRMSSRTYSHMYNAAAIRGA